MRGFRIPTKSTFKIALFILILPATNHAYVHTEVQPAQSQIRSARKQKITLAEAEPQKILYFVYEMSIGAPAYERAFLLQKLAEVSLAMKEKNAPRYAHELFEASLAVTPEWQNYRRAFQAASVRFMVSAGKLDEALELFDRMDPPPAERADREGDIREGSLINLLSRMLDRNRSEGLDWAAQKVMKLAASGAFPYMASAEIIQEALRDESPAAPILYAQAIAHFETGKTNQLDRQNFVDLLLLFAGKFDAALERQGVLAAVSTLLGAPQVKGQRFQANLTLEKGSRLNLQSREDLLLYRMLPLLAKYDSERAEKIVKQRTNLQSALQEGGAIKEQQGLLIVGTAEDSPQKLDAAAARVQAWNQVRKVSELASRDPDQALGTSRAIEIPAARAAAVAAAAASIAKSDPSQAQTLLAEAAASVEKIKDPKDRLRLLVNLVPAYVALNDTTQVAETYAAILELGTELLELELASERRFPLPMTITYGQIAQATRSAAKLHPEARLSQLTQIKNQPLQWHLMIEVARTIHDARQT